MSVVAPPKPDKEYLAMPMGVDPSLEQWREAVYPGIAPGYQVSTFGNATSPSGRSLTVMNRDGLPSIAFRTTDGRNTSVRLDRLVLSTFVGNEELKSPLHKDDDIFNCRLDNLMWGEPTLKELAGLRASLTRRKALVSSVAETKKRPGRKKARGRPPAKKMSHQVVMLRLYQYDDVEVTVGIDGGVQSIKPDPNKVGLTPYQTMALADILMQVSEMNALMGVKPVAK